MKQAVTMQVGLQAMEYKIGAKWTLMGKVLSWHHHHRIGHRVEVPSPPQSWHHHQKALLLVDTHHTSEGRRVHVGANSFKISRIWINYWVQMSCSSFIFVTITCARIYELRN